MTTREQLAELTRSLREDYGITTPGAEPQTIEETPGAPKPRLNKDGSTWAEDLDLVFDFDRAAREQSYYEKTTESGEYQRAVRAREARKAAAETAEKRSAAKTELTRRLAESDGRAEAAAKQRSEREAKERERVSAEWKKSGGSRLP